MLSRSSAPAVALLIGLTGMLAGVVVDRGVLFFLPLAMGADAGTGQEQRLVLEAWKTIDAHYVDRSALVPPRLAYGAIDGMVTTLGDTGHTAFLTPQMVTLMKDMEQDHFTGIGAEVQMKDGRVVVVAPIDGSPASKAGLHAGDVILEVDGRDVRGAALTAVVARIRGRAGTVVTLTVRNPADNSVRTLHVTRQEIAVDTVTWATVPGTSIADVRISTFTKGTSVSLAKVLAAAQERGASGLILDLRRNPGGLLEEAVGVASQFLDSGNVLQERDAQGKVTPVPVEANVKRCRLPAVVLVDGGTASAAEIVSGALQDAGRASLVGETTFGTGTVLQQYPLSDGSALLLAIREWLTPKGRSFWHRGLTPGYVVQQPASVPLLTPAAATALSVDALHASPDTQFLEALQLVEDAG